MALDKMKNETPVNELPQCITGTLVTDEYRKLSEFAYELCTFYSIADCCEDPAYDSNIIEEAQLLMNLLSPTLSGSCCTKVSIAPPSSMSALDSSDHPDSKCPSTHGPNQFSFTCPTLSLEKQSNKHGISQLHIRDVNLHPALLLGRCFKVDDRGALRLSSDAMARNILRSFQKSLQCRVEDWTSVLTRQLIRSEKELSRVGAKSEEVHALLRTSEAVLISKLQNVGECLSVASVRTSFHVLPEKVQVTESGSRLGPKRQRIDGGDSGSEFSKLAIEEQDTYLYNVYHRLKFQCIINIGTPAGFSEVSIDVPGIIEGTFSSAREDSISVCSVRVKLDTNMLAAMMEKSCRTVVRASVEAFLESEELALLPVSPHLTELKEDSGHCQLGWLQPRPAFVTPNSDSGSKPQCRYPESSILMPIAEDLVSDSEQMLPRRISPPPIASVSCPPPDGKNSEEQSQRNGIFTHPLYQVTRTDSSLAKMERSRRLPLISPPPSEPVFKDLELGGGPLFPSFQYSPNKGPAWPMLVEAAFYVEE